VHLNTITLPLVPLWKDETEQAQETQILYGESFEPLGRHNNHAKVRLVRDGYEGYLRISALATHVTPTHKVTKQGANCHASPSVKSPTLYTLPFGAQVKLVKEEGDYAQLHTGDWLYKPAITPINTFEQDPASVALRFLGTPYQWGGRSSFCIDCSGLMQTAFHACGVDFPRDSHQQEAKGEAINAPLQRGDVVFWKGHVGMMMNAHALLHANAYTMDVTCEELSDARARILHRGGGDIRSLRRVSYKSH
jgi:cell wall-associated NlpC family hydrolase